MNTTGSNGQGFKFRSESGGFEIMNDELRAKRCGLLAAEAAALSDLAKAQCLPPDLVIFSEPVRYMIDDIVDMLGNIPKVRAHLRVFCQRQARTAAARHGLATN